MSNVKISELETTSAVSTSDLMETAIPSGNTYASKKMSIAQLATYLENSVVHSALDTTNKTIIDAINELKSICDNLSASHFIVANQLPTSDINMNAIYLIPKQSTVVNDVYEEYICLDDTTTPATWEKIGETQIDLSNYITFDDADIATTSKNGSMSKADRSKMNGIESGAQKNVQSDWNASSGDALILNKPTIPTVNDNTISITQNGTAVDSFTLNQNSNKTIEVKDEKVKQRILYGTTDTNYHVLLANSNSLSDETAMVWKETNLRYNPYTKTFTFNNIKIDTVTTSMLTLVYGNESRVSFQIGSGFNNVMLTPPSSSGELALRSDYVDYVSNYINPVRWSENNLLGAKNLLPHNPYNPSGYVQNGITFDVLEDGTVVADGTKTTAANNSTFNISERYENTGLFLPNGTYFLSGCPEGGGTTTYQIGAAYLNSSNTYTSYGFDNGEGVEFTVDGSRYSDDGAWVRIFITIRGGYASVSDMQFNPMLRLASISDDTYTPPAMTNRNLTLEKHSWEDNKASGVKNYFPYPFEIHPKQGEVYTQRAIQWTDGGNGIIVANGTNDNTGNSYCQLLPTSETSGGVKIRFCTLPAGKYHFSGGISADYYLNLSTGLKSAPTDRTTLGEDFGEGFDFEVTEAMAQNNMFCSFSFVKKGKSATDVQFKPMITRYEDSSVGFAEYAMTNKELTQYKTDMMTIATTETSGTASRAYAKNELMFWRRGLYRVTQAISSGGSITLNTNVVATTLSDEIRAIRDALSI